MGRASARSDCMCSWRGKTDYVGRLAARYERQALPQEGLNPALWSGHSKSAFRIQIATHISIALW